MFQIEIGRSYIVLSFYKLLTFATTKKRKKKTTHATAKKYAASKGIRGKEDLNVYKFFKKIRNFKSINLMVLFLSILFGINGSLVSFVGYATYQERNLLQSESATEFSVPCDDLSLSADEDFILFDVKKRDLKTFIDDNGKYICNKSNVTETIKIMNAKEIVEREARLRLAKGEYSDTKLSWDVNSANCRIDPSVYYNDGEITIPDGRTYFVYVTVHVNISHQEDTRVTGRPQRFSIRICQSVYGYERTLLGRTVWFRNTTNDENGVSSLHIGSHLELSRNDKIYVRVSNAKEMMSNSSGNNFGLFPL